MSTRSARRGAASGVRRRLAAVVAAAIDLTNLYKAPQTIDSMVSANPELAPLAAQPAAIWINNQSDADNLASAVTNAAGKTLIICVYAIPGRDSGNYSAGGFPDRASYLSFITSIKNQLGNAPAIISYEPDALGLTPGMSAANKTERVETLRQAINILATVPNAETYVDASQWIAIADQANMVQSVDIAKIAGFTVNTSGYDLQSSCYTYGNSLVSALNDKGITGKKFIVDSSRNGAGPLTESDRPLATPWLDTSQAWCNPPNRRSGLNPGTAISGQPNVRATLWIKKPGESDGAFPTTSQSSYYGENAPSAGTFWVANARMLLGLSPQKSGASGTTNTTKFGTIAADFTSGYGPFTNYTGGVTLTGGRVRIPAGTGYENISTPETYTLKDSSIYAQVVPPTNTGATSSSVVQFLITTSSNAAGTRLVAAVDTKANNLYIGKEVGYSDSSATRLTYDATAHAWLRWREASGTTYVDTSPDSTTWTNRASFTTPAYVTATSVQQAQFVVYKDAGTGYAEIDNVNTAQAAAAAQSPGLASITEDFTSSLGAFSAVSTNVTLTSGRVRIPATTAYESATTSGTYTLSGSSIYAQVFTPSNSGASASIIQFLVTSTTAAGGTRLCAAIDTVAGTLYVGSEVSYSDNNAVRVTYNATSMAWLRWRESSGTTYLDTSPDGSTWTNQRSLTTPAYVTPTATLKPSFVAYKDSGAATYAEIDNVNTVPAVVVSPAYASSTSTTNSGVTTITGTKPTGSASGDLLLAFYSATTGGDVAPIATSATAPSGWTQLSSVTDTAHTLLRVFYADGAVATTAFPVNASCSVSLGIVRITGVSGTSSIRTAATSYSATASPLSIAAPTVTPTKSPGVLLCAVADAPLANSTLTAPSNMAMALTQLQGGQYAQLGVAYKTFSTTAATGAQTFTNSTTNSGAGWASTTVAITAP